MMARPATSAAAEPGSREPAQAPHIGAAPLEIERQQINGRLKTIERRLKDHASRLILVEPILPGDRAAARTAGGLPPPDPLRSNDRRLTLERRGLDQRRDAIDRGLGRAGGDSNPSSGALLERLRGDQK